METDRVKIGTRLADIRNSRNMSQEDVAEILMMSRNQVSRVESGKSLFSLKRLILFCQYFNCSLDYVIFGNKNNAALSKLPENIVDILSLEESEDQEILLKYIFMYNQIKGD